MKISDLINPKNVAKAIESPGKPSHSMLCGVLASIGKGGRTIEADESTRGKADHYWRVLNGVENEDLGDKQFEEITNLVKLFVSGPSMHSRKASIMNPSDLSKNLRRIASAIENSINPSKELVLNDLKLIMNRIASKFDKAKSKLKEMDDWQKKAIGNDIYRIVEECGGANDVDSPYSYVFDDELVSMLENYEDWTVGDFRALAVGMGMASDLQLNESHYSY